MLDRGRPPSSVEAELQQEIGKAELKSELFGVPREAVLVGRFQLRQRLGRGSMGVVYEAYDPQQGRAVALKLLQYPEPRPILRLKREFRSLVAISHPNLVGLDALFCERGMWFFSMELVGGGLHFDEWICSAPRKERLARLRAGLTQLVAAVDTLHRAGKLHRDLKPSNVLVSAAGRVVVVDFGLVIDTTGIGTLHSGLVGTPAYLSPEQAQGRAAGPASDWYAVGVMLFEALTQRLPFEGPPMQVVRDKQVVQPARARDLLREYDGAQVAELCELCDALLSPDPDKRPQAEVIRAVVSNSATSAPSVSVSALRGDDSGRTAHSTPFVGREPELAALRSALADMRNGATVTLFLAGRSGVGKSALLDRIVAEIDEDTIVLRGRCHEHECMPYKVFDEVVGALGRKLSGLPAAELEALVPRHAQSLQRLFPELGRLEAFARRSSQLDVTRDPRELRNEAFTALKELLLRLTDTQPLVIVVDDLQWGDADSARMLGHLLNAPEPPPLLLLGAFRGDEVERSEFLAEVLRRDRRHDGAAPRVIDVEPLPHRAAELLAQQLMEREGLGDDPGLASRIAHESQGLAFFICELVRHQVANTARSPRHSLSLERAILERVAVLPPSAQRLLRVLSVASAPLEQHVALRAAELAPEEREAVHALRAARLLRSHAGPLADGLEVYHDRVREIVVSQLDAKVARDVHARIAEALEALDISDPERLVTHYAGAGDRGCACARAIQGAEAASVKLAFNRAADLLRLAIEYSEDDHVQRRRLQRCLGDVLVTAGRGAEAAAAYLSAAEESDPRTARELQRLAAMHNLRSGRTAAGWELAGKVFAAVGLAMPDRGVRAVGAYLWQRTRLELRPLAISRPDVLATPVQLERLDCMLAVFPELSFSDPAPGAVLQAQFLNEALAAGEPQRLLQGLVYEVFNLARLGGKRNRRRALAALDRARELATQLGTAYARGMVSLAEASYHFWSGCAFQSVLLPCTLARQAFGEVGSEASLERGLAAFMHLTALEFSGGLGELCSGGMQMLGEAEDRDDRFVAMLAVLSVPCAYAMRGQAEDGLRVLREQERYFPPGYTTFRQLWLIRTADMFNYLGRHDEALDVLAQYWSSFLRSSHRRTVLAGSAMHASRARTALMSYLAGGDPAVLAMLRSDLHYLRRSPTIFRHVVNTASAALMWHRGERQNARRSLEEVLPDLRAADSESAYVYTQLAHARLSGDADKRREVMAQLSAQGVHDPERWAWTYVPVGDRP